MTVPGNFAVTQSRSDSHTFFVTAKTSQGKALLQSERMANLFIDVLRSYARNRSFKVHEFVVMRNYVQLLISVNGETTIDHALRKLKGTFAGRANREIGIRGWIWEFESKVVRVPDRACFLKYKADMENQPIKAGLAPSADALSK